MSVSDIEITDVLLALTLLESLQLRNMRVVDVDCEHRMAVVGARKRNELSRQLSSR
jgi:hypothetical protein